MTPKNEGPRPNVLVIITDDQRVETMGAMPKTRAWFGQRGTRYPWGTVTTPLCCPSRASIFTGLMAHNHDVHTNAQGDLIDERRTLHRYLQDAGYRTGLAGKYFNKWDLGREPRYLDRWALFNSGYREAEFNVDGRRRRVGTYVTDFLAEWSVRFLEETEEDDERPWLLYVTPYAPHRPSTPAPRDESVPIARWRGNAATREVELGDKPLFVRDQGVSFARGLEKRAVQLRSLMAVDDLVARIAGSLDELGEEESTVAFFLSDNGFLWSEHGLRDKRLPYLPSVRVPFLVRWPAGVEAGAIDHRLVANIDVAPTVLDLVGSPPAEPMDGRSLAGTWTRDHLALEYFEAGGRGNVPSWGAILTKRLEYVEYDDQAGRVLFREYYDLTEDPWQLDNLFADGDPNNDPDVTSLSRRLAADRECAGTQGAGACP